MDDMKRAAAEVVTRAVKDLGVSSLSVCGIFFFLKQLHQNKSARFGVSVVSYLNHLSQTLK